MGEQIHVRVAELRSARADAVLISMGLGSCVAVLLHDPPARVGGLSHILLPSRSLNRGGADHLGRFPQSAIPALVTEMVALGADPRRLVARLVGGANMFANLIPAGSMQMGERNQIAVREVLSQLAIPVVAVSVGGTVGRSVWFHVADGRVVVRVIGQREQVL
ncbi:MAG TPA: chemotaxis protein CheD [Gemmatimonadales bacterium]|jgi:chemotaxis protein CheD